MHKLKIATLLLLTLAPAMATAQGSRDAYQFLGVPASSHVAALGGKNISVIDDDATLAFSNPALLSSVSDKSLALNYTSYISHIASAIFSRQTGERGTWAVGAHYADYGDFKAMSELGEETGTFSAKDIALHGMYSYNLSEKVAGGITAKFITSSYESYSAIAVGVDLGLNYYDEDNEFSASIAVKNLGGQIKAFEETRETLPTDIQVGFTKRMEHAPFRISVTMTDLNHWSKDYYFKSDGTDDSFKHRFLKHFVFGVDLLPSDNMYLSIGYNARRNSEMKVADSSHGAGWSYGAGLKAGKINVGIAYAKYHVSSSSLLCNFSVRL